MEFFKPTLQTKFGTDGNCFSACIATMFDCPINDIPDFETDDGMFDLGWVCDWFVGRFGKICVTVRWPLDEDFETNLQVLGGSLMITSINSNSPDSLIKKHAVITKKNKVIFDPMVGVVNRKLTVDDDPMFFVVGDYRAIIT